MHAVSRRGVTVAARGSRGRAGSPLRGSQGLSAAPSPGPPATRPASSTAHFRPPRRLEKARSLVILEENSLIAQVIQGRERWLPDGPSLTENSCFCGCGFQRLAPFRCPVAAREWPRHGHSSLHLSMAAAASGFWP